MGETWRIELLGGLRAGRSPQSLTPLPTGKPAVLLAYLAFYPLQAHPRETLIELLWPECDPEAGRLRLRVTLHDLRRWLDTRGAAPPGLLAADRVSVCLDTALLATDVAEFRAALLEPARAPTPAARAEALARAVALYGGELLPGCFEPWVLAEREHLMTVYLEAMRQLVQAREESGDLAGALSAAQEAVKVDPLREEAHYDLMRLYAATGQPAACLRQYEELEERLRAELGEAPSVEARALAEELRVQARTLVVVRRPPRVPGGGMGARGGWGERRRGRDGLDSPSPPPPVPPSSPRAVLPSPRLPVQLTHFFGREAETAQLAEWLTSGGRRLVTVTGPGGSGKTRLAIAVAGRLQELFGDAVAFVPLADLSDAGRIPEAVAAALELIRSPQMDALEQVTGHLAARPWLLVLDNFEHLVEEGALLVRRLLERVPTLICLVTSRQRLGISGEQEFALLPLPTPRGSVFGVRCSVFGSGLPKTEHRTPNTEHLMQYASVQLFMDRARAVCADFQLTAANAAAVGELCDRLEGLPLAIELAAARAAVLSPQQMLTGLEERFTLLVSRQRDLPLRHRTLRAVIEGSYQLLPPVVQRFFTRLAVFRGGWTLEAARAICEAEGATDEGARSPAARAPGEPSPGLALDHLELLRECSLVLVEEEAGGKGRYRLLETLREFAWESLAASGELAATRERHRDWYLQFMEQMFVGDHQPERDAWLKQVETEIDNLRAALAWCEEEADADPHSDGAVAGLRLALRIPWVLTRRRADLAEGTRWLEGALARGRELPARLRADALLTLAYFAGDREGLKGRRELLLAAREPWETALEQARGAGKRADVLHGLRSLADIALRLGDEDLAWTLCVETHQVSEAGGEPPEIIASLELMAGVLLERGEVAAARPLLERRLALCRRLHSPSQWVHALGAMGHVERGEANYARARAYYQESLRVRRELGYLFQQAQGLEDLDSVAIRQGEAEHALRLLGASEAMCESLGVHPPIADAREYEPIIAQSRAALGEAAFAAAWAEGRAMSLEQAVEYALAEG